MLSWSSTRSADNMRKWNKTWSWVSLSMLARREKSIEIWKRCIWFLWKKWKIQVEVRAKFSFLTVMLLSFHFNKTVGQKVSNYGSGFKPSYHLFFFFGWELEMNFILQVIDKKCPKDRKYVKIIINYIKFKFVSMNKLLPDHGHTH